MASILGVVTVLPGMILFFVAALSSSNALNDTTSNVWILGSIITLSLFVIVLLGTLSLAVSSMTSDKRYAGAGIFILFIFSGIISEMLKTILENERFALISLWTNIDNIGNHLFNVKSSYSFPWYESLFILLLLMICSAGIIYWRVFKKEMAV